MHNSPVQCAITLSCLQGGDITCTTATCYPIPLTVALVGRPVVFVVPFLATRRKVEVHQALSRDWIFWYTGATPTNAARLNPGHAVLVSVGAIEIAVVARVPAVIPGTAVATISGQPRIAVLA